MYGIFDLVLLLAVFDSNVLARPLVAEPKPVFEIEINSKNTLNTSTNSANNNAPSIAYLSENEFDNNPEPDPDSPTTTASSSSFAAASPSSTSTSTSGSKPVLDFNANSTSPSATVSAASPSGTASAPSGRLSLSFVNNVADSSINAYVSGIDSKDQLVLLKADGTFYYPAKSSPGNNSGVPLKVTENVALPLGATSSQVNFNLPDYISASRIWFSNGTLEFFTVPGFDNSVNLVEPSAVNPSDPAANLDWGFVELTYTPEAGIYADISYVDFVGLPLGMTLQVTNGSTQNALGLPGNAVELICNDLKAQAAVDKQPWDELCMIDKTTNRPLRVISPTNYLSLKPTAFQNYWNSYVDAVWSHYATNTLTINTQSSPGLVNCTVHGDLLTCAGDNRGYAKPSASDIFGCNSGPFAISSTDNAVHRAVVPRLCAAFNRGTFLISGGNVQPGVGSDKYYTTPVVNWYSAIVHKHESDGKGYSFAYDDVIPDGGKDSAGVVKDGNPQILKVIVGGPTVQEQMAAGVSFGSSSPGSSPNSSTLSTLPVPAPAPSTPSTNSLTSSPTTTRGPQTSATASPLHFPASAAPAPAPTTSAAPPPNTSPFSAPKPTSTPAAAALTSTTLTIASTIPTTIQTQVIQTITSAVPSTFQTQVIQTITSAARGDDSLDTTTTVFTTVATTTVTG